MKDTPRSLSAALVLAFACAAAAITVAANAADAPASSLHPLAGTWTGSPFNSKCVENFQYRINNTLLVTSGESISEWNYTVTPQADALGFYTVVETSMRNNGKKDCSGDTVDAWGMVATRHMQFSPARDRMIVCREASLAACFGPLRREPPGGK